MVKSVHYKRTVARVHRTPTPTALQVATITARKPCRHTEATCRALSTLLSAPLAATRGSGASSKMSSSVQHSPADEARRCRLLRHRTRTHKFRDVTECTCHVMGRAMRGAGSRTRVAIKAAATNGAKDARRSRALCTRCVLAVLAGDRRRLAVHAVLAREEPSSCRAKTATRRMSSCV